MPRRLPGGKRQLAIHVVKVVHRQRPLPQIVYAFGPPRRLASGLNRRQKQRYQDADDSDDDEQLDEREAVAHSPDMHMQERAHGSSPSGRVKTD